MAEEALATAKGPLHPAHRGPGPFAPKGARRGPRRGHITVHTGACHCAPQGPQRCAHRAPVLIRGPSDCTGAPALCTSGAPALCPQGPQQLHTGPPAICPQGPCHVAPKRLRHFAHRGPVLLRGPSAIPAPHPLGPRPLAPKGPSAAAHRGCSQNSQPRPCPTARPNAGAPSLRLQGPQHCAPRGPIAAHSGAPATPSPRWGPVAVTKGAPALGLQGTLQPPTGARRSVPAGLSQNS